MRLLAIALLLCPTLLNAQTRYASEALKLRAGASERARVLATIPSGSAVDVRDCERAGGEWCLAVYGGQRGFVEARLLDVESAHAVIMPLSSNPPALSTRGVEVQPQAMVPAPRATTPATTREAPRLSATARGYYRGPRGGCYTYSASGRKRYVDRSLCD